MKGMQRDAHEKVAEIAMKIADGEYGHDDEVRMTEIQVDLNFVIEEEQRMWTIREVLRRALWQFARGARNNPGDCTEHGFSDTFMLPKATIDKALDRIMAVTEMVK